MKVLIIYIIYFLPRNYGVMDVYNNCTNNVTLTRKYILKNPSQFYYFCVRYNFFLTILLLKLFSRGPITIDLKSSKDNFFPENHYLWNALGYKNIVLLDYIKCLARTTKKPYRLIYLLKNGITTVSIIVSIISTKRCICNNKNNNIYKAWKQRDTHCTHEMSNGLSLHV